VPRWYHDCRVGIRGRRRHGCVHRITATREDRHRCLRRQRTVGRNRGAISKGSAIARAMRESPEKRCDERRGDEDPW
jgi:hypothetical protein